MEESITMSGKEVDRPGIGKRRRKEAGGQLGLRPGDVDMVAWMKRSEIRGWRAALSRISAFGLHPGYMERGVAGSRGQA
ncbi:hypothetical protein BMS3Bbin12_01006 [bacterium BMS3Bbin12]|nr:hypothetical protein BMS3Abin12_01446 [bacterium BMS3Abin12]GBE47838.1 hypothetical protein BMS3Bbin12_01006 [bacterium BMS3Bbin12]GBE51085.1 hypothetical protein BMS3Bbin13_02039 [bacterium BMS3Bbin13]